MAALPELPAHLAAYGCLTPLGNAMATHRALLRGEIALRATPVRGREGGDLVPLALLPGRALDETSPPAWLADVRALLASLPTDGWGTARKPVFVTSSNFGVGNLHAFRRGGDSSHLRYGAPGLCVEWLQRELGWGGNVTIFSHACVSAHLGLIQATRAVNAGVADEALVFSFDFLSPFVAGGFHALKILNANFPAPYAERATGAIGLGDGAAFAVVKRGRGEFTLLGQNLFNEMHHFTANQPDGSGFVTCLAPISALAAPGRTWLKGHGTGTIEAGRLEATTFVRQFPGAPLVGWKGALGHTLGSCGLVELALAIESIKAGVAPGTIGSSAPLLAGNVLVGPLDLSATDAVTCASNAFGGAHAALLLGYAGSGVPRSPSPAADREEPAPGTWAEERFLSAVAVDDPGLEEPAATKERLKGLFAPGATRRMTQLGLLVGSVLGQLDPEKNDTVIYASGFGESRALEGYLESFPEASPTLFQTSIHPSGAQQALVGRQRSLHEVFPLAGPVALPLQALLTGFLAPARRVLVCGGEERGTWLLEYGVASDRAFAFALALGRTSDGAAGKIKLSAVDPADPVAPREVASLAAFFDALRDRTAWAAILAPGLKLELTWW